MIPTVSHFHKQEVSVILIARHVHPTSRTNGPQIVMNIHPQKMVLHHRMRHGQGLMPM